MTEETVKVEVVEKKKGLMNNTLQELEDLDIQLLKVIQIGEISIALTNDQLIKLINFNAGKDVIGWNTTAERSMEMAGHFL